MKTLVVAATTAEIRPLLAYFNIPEADFAVHAGFDVLITGVGMTATAFALGKHLHNNYHLILNLGIAGSFDSNFPPGTVVNITADTFSELGAQAPDHFISIDALGFGKGTYIGSTVPGLPSAKGITVNTVHGDAPGITEVVTRLHPQTESMEGAAVFYCATAAGINCLQIRSISNFVTPRDKESWQIGLAIKQLNEWAINFLTSR